MIQIVPNPPRHRVAAGTEAFSLVELAVVIAVIAICASLLLPAMAGATRHARSTQCVNNLHQLGIALNLYVQEANCFPLATQDGITGAWQPSLRAAAPGLMFCCPVQAPPSTNFVHIFNWTGDVSPYYGYNAMGAAWKGSPPFNPGLGGDVNLDNGSRVPTGANRVMNPAQMVMVGDSSTFIDVIFGTQPQSNIPNQIYIAFPYPVAGCGMVGVGNWHDGNANMVFGDCHVQFARQSFWIAATDQSRRLWNSDNQPHEEWW